MADDVLAEPLSLTAAQWGVPSGTGLGIQVDEDKVKLYHALYQQRGPFLPYTPEMLAAEDRLSGPTS